MALGDASAVVNSGAKGDEDDWYVVGVVVDVVNVTAVCDASVLVVVGTSVLEAAVVRVVVGVGVAVVNGTS